ncbi:uncharacterized protein LOC578316 [Strongylocentrotus purpuratus]|uniref:Uncharacterized protein n=1 Tax=Strongylocentrotus purpuratus TaxID=7668 RepID=A0A7M7P3N6_STRPU|nr:uncharacterized protein LOC578316 [Strongylocentrotus purpuratus]
MENIPSTSSSSSDDIHEAEAWKSCFRNYLIKHQLQDQEAASVQNLTELIQRPLALSVAEPGAGALAPGGTSSASGTPAPANTREYLNGLWNKGMTNSKTGEAKRLMTEAVAVTKMKYSQIKNFIDNRRRKEVKATQDKISKTGNRRLYDIFMSQELNKYCDDNYLGKEEKLKLAHDSWKELRNDPTTLAKLKSLKEEGAKEATGQPSVYNSKATKLLMRKWVKDIDNKCKAMNELGYESLFLAVHRTEDAYNQTGTEQALVVAHQKRLISSLGSAAIQEETTSRSLESLSDEVLRSRVQAHFNTAYMKCLGKPRTGYDRIGAGEVRVTGMPPGIPFRRPGTYGRKTKIRILQEAVNIKFSVVSEEEGDIAEVEVQDSEDALPVPGERPRRQTKRKRQNAGKMQRKSRREHDKTDSPRQQGTLALERRADVTESATRGARGGAMGGAKNRAAATLSPTPNASSHQQMSTVPEPIAEISTIHDDTSHSTTILKNSDRRNPDIHRQSDIEFVGAEMQSGFGSTMSSVLESAENYQKLGKGCMRRCSRSNLRHSQSVSDVRSLSDSEMTQHDQIESNGRMIGFLMDDVKHSKARFEALEKRQVAGCRHNRQSTSTHFIPYDSEKKQGRSFFILPTTDLKLQAELFLIGFGSGSGTHLSLKVTADAGYPSEAGQLPSQCRFEIRIHNFDDEEETRMKSKNSEENGSSHIVEFPKVIEKDVVENEALGFKRNGMLKITLIVSWDEAIDQ